MSSAIVPCQSPTISPDAEYMAWTCAASGSENATLYLQATCLTSSSGCSIQPVTISSSMQNGSPIWVGDGGRFTAFQNLLEDVSEAHSFSQGSF